MVRPAEQSRPDTLRHRLTGSWLLRKWTPSQPSPTRGGTAFDRARPLATELGTGEVPPPEPFPRMGEGQSFLLAGRGGFGFGLAWCGAAVAHPDGYPHQRDE